MAKDPGAPNELERENLDRLRDDEVLGTPADQSAAVGLWECLADAGECTMAAPDPRTPGRPFEGPVQGPLDQPVTCPECGGTKVIYRGDKTTAASAA